MGVDPWAHMPPAMRDRVAREEAAEQRAWEQRLYDQAERQAEALERAAHQARCFEYETGHDPSEYRHAVAQLAMTREGRDPAAEYGSAQRAAVLIDGRELVAREMAAGPITQQPDSYTAQLARARAQQDPSARAFMLRMVDDLDRRNGSKGTISRSEAPDTVTCLDCIEQNATAAESFLLHSDPDDPLPEKRVPDYAPSRSRRVRSGTGWPELVR